jgi:hypothetical protein
VTVAGQDITGIRLELSNQTTLSGIVRVEGQGAPLHQVAHVALHSSSYQLGAAVQADGSFEFRGLPPDNYRVLISPGGAAYLRSAWQGGRDVLHEGLTISGETPAEPLEITLGAPGGTVDGTVALRDAGQPDLMVVALLRRAGDAMVLEKQVSVSVSLPAGASFSLNISRRSMADVGLPYKVWRLEIIFYSPGRRTREWSTPIRSSRDGMTTWENRSLSPRVQRSQ